MLHEDYIRQALEIVTAWDIQDEYLADAIIDQARQMAGVNPDELPEQPSDIH